MADKNQVLAARQAVDAYREAHRGLHGKPWHQGVPEEHTPLLDAMLAALGEQGFGSLGDFFTESELANVQELGYADQAEFDARSSAAEKEALSRMWQ